MYIKELIITSFGKYQNKKISLKPGINIIYGENEAGKSTVHKFIEAMFFGFYKDHKSRRTYNPDYEKYLPMFSSSYEGILIYEEDCREVRIERNLLKGKDKVVLYDEGTGEDISKEFYYDSAIKLYAPFEQSMMNRRIYNNTVSISQLGCRTSKELSEELKDYLANLGESKGDLSVQKALKSLNDSYNEIGTERRKDSPIYKVKYHIKSLQEDKDKIRSNMIKVEELTEEINKIEDRIQKAIIEREEYHKNILSGQSYEALCKVQEYESKLEENNEILKKISKISYEEVSEEEYDHIKGMRTEIDILEKHVEDMISKKGTHKTEIKDEQNQQRVDSLKEKQNQSKRFMILSSIASICGLLGSILHPLFYTLLIFIFFVIYFYKKTSDYSRQYEEQRRAVGEEFVFERQKTKEFNETIDDYKSKIERLDLEVRKLLQKNKVVSIEAYEAHLKSKRDVEALEKQLENSAILLETLIPLKELDKWQAKALEYSQYAEFKGELDLDALVFKKNAKDKEINDMNLKKSKLQGSVESILDELVDLSDVENDIHYHERELEKLQGKQDALQLAMDTIQKLSAEIHNEFAPELNRLLGKIVGEITEKYKVVKVSKDLEIKVEDPIYHQFIDLNKLSSGTMDQIYFAFRLGLNEFISSTTFPVLLDETFIQYDENRLSNVLKYIIKKSSNRQIIIFTSQRREMEIMSKYTEDFQIIKL